MLEVGGHLTMLRRTRVGPFDVADAHSLEALAERFAMTELSAAAADLFPVRDVTDHEAGELSFGRAIEPTGTGAELTAARRADGTVVALIKDARRRGQDIARPHLVFSPSEGPGEAGAQKESHP